MQLHQILTGSCNINDQCLSFGSILSEIFISYGSGSDLVILNHDFMRQQIIPGCNNENSQIVSVSCTFLSGKILVLSSNNVCIYEPYCEKINNSKIDLNMFFWELKSILDIPVQNVKDICWIPSISDTIILVGKYLQVWKKEKAPFYLDNAKDIDKWSCLWNKLSPGKSTIDRIKFSSDGKYFATLCLNSNDLYIWFWDQCSSAYFNESVEKSTNDLFDYIAIKHPTFIISFEWRKISNYAPKNSINNSILTCSADNVCRIWSETHINQCQKNSHFNGFFNGNSKDMKIPDYFKNIFSNYIKQKRFDLSKELLDLSNTDHSLAFKDTHYIYTYPEFVLSASINDTTDVPLFTTLNSEKSSAPKLPFIIHWLNNKDYNFNNQIEKFFNYLLSNLNYKNSEELVNDNIGEFSRHILLSINKWKSSCDVLFSIHPQNGSLLAWFIHNLDESGSCLRENNSIMFDKSIHIKNSQVTVHSCLPNCIPAADASSMNTNIMLYCDEIPLKYSNENSYEIINEFPINHNVKMISKQQNGSLNMWSLTVSNEQNGNTSFLNIKHLSRISGHRWQTNSAECHIQLPFLLTISNSYNGNDYNSESSELILWRIKSIGPFSKCGGITEIARINSNNYLNFVMTAWLPGIIPTYLFGIDMSSPASIFIATDFQNKLFIYITFADAKNLLEKHAFQNEKNCQYAKNVQCQYNIVSITSTGEPGCILSAGPLEDYSGKSCDSVKQKTETLFLHVFPKDMIFNDLNCNIENEFLDAKAQAKSKTKYCETFFVVRIIRKECLLEPYNESLLEMWKVQLIDNKKNEKLKTLDDLIKFHIIKEKVYSKILKIPKNVAIIKAVPAASHLSSASIYPSCLAPYLISTMCSDGAIRFWRCSTKKNNSNYKFKWVEWTMPLQDQYSSKLTFKTGDIPLEISCAYSGRIAVAYSDNISSFQQPYINININIYECESTGGSEWILEDTIQFFNVHVLTKYKNSSENTPHQSQLMSENESFSKNKSCKDLIQVDWVNSEDGTYLLSIAIGTKIMIFTPACSESFKYSRFISEKSPLAKSIHWMKIDEIQLKTADSMLPLPVHISWAREGLLIVGLDNEVHVYNQWNSYTNKYESSTNRLMEEVYDHKNDNEIIKITPKANYSLARLRDAYLFNSNFKRSLSKVHIKSIDVDNDSEFSDEILQNAGLFEAAQIHNPVLPQYHPKQLMEWINFGKIKRVKAILSHLTICISNDNLHYKNNMKSINNEIDEPKIEHFDESLYEMGQLEIKAIPPLPLYILLEIDSKSVSKTAEKSNSLFFSETDLTEQDESHNLKLTFESESKNVPWMVCNVNEFSNFSPEEAHRLSNCLTRVQLPGLSALDQIYLLGIAELMCNLKNEISDQMNFNILKDQKELNSNSTNSMDECGLRFLLAMQHFSYMTRTLPMNQRNNLMIQGIDTSCLIWGFHSETEEELCVRLDEITFHCISWVDFRRYGCGWWIRNNNLLQRMIEKVAKNSFQKSKDPMDSAVFYLAMGKQKLLAKLFKNCNKTALFNFFNLDFSLDDNKNRALNQAYNMRSKRRFDHAVALFLLCHAIEDAILICLHNLKDIQLALMISRLYDLNISRSTENLHYIIRNHVVLSNDPYIRSMGYWMLEEYTNSLDSLLKEPSNNTDDLGKMVPDTLCNSSDAIVFVFFNFLKRHPIIIRQKLVLNKNTDQKPNDSITPMERRLYFRTAYTYLRMGCPDLALEVLSKLPERMEIQNDESIINSKIITKFEENVEMLDFTYDNAPTVESISFKIQWDDNENTESKKDNNNDFVDSFSNSVMDIMCLQYKFMICLKLISEELCTLATGIESHGSYLRYHLYTWLEKEVQVLRNLCSYSSNYKNENVKLLFDENSKFSIKERVLLRKQWLKVNQSLIINLYSFCSLHGPNIVGLAAIRMELLILIQELQGNNCIHFDSCLDSHSSVNLPFVNSSISPDSGLILTPIQQLNIFILEITDCINSFKCPFSFIYHHSFHCNNKSENETDENKSKIKLLRNQCQSLSACLHQCLSNFTGIKNNEDFNYDKKRRPRQSSTSVIYSADSDIQLRSKYLSELQNNQKYIPNSDPIKWPGYVNLFKIIGCKANGSITNFSHMLAEALVAVYTGILIYALHLNDSNLLYRLINIDFNKNLWGKIFGGTFRQKPDRPSGPPVGSPGSNRESSKVKKEGGNHKVQVSPSMPRNRLYSRLSPPINMKAQSVDEKFIPPLYPILTCLLEKPAINSKSIEFIYDSDMEELEENLDSFTETEDVNTNKECTNNKSYTWTLLRLIVLQSVDFEIKELLKILQIENGELAIFCPNIYSIESCISEWQNQCKIHLNNYSSIPKSYLEFFKDCQKSSKNDHVSTRLINLCKNFGNYENSPFKNRTNISLSMKRLWFSLIKKKKLQPIFVQHFLSSRHYETEKDSNQSESMINSFNSEINKNIRIIHKEHESLFSMAINQIDNSLLVTSTSKEIIELSVNHFNDSENWYQHDYDYLLNTIKETEKIKNANKNSEKCLTSDFLLISPTFGSTINFPTQDYSNSNVILKRPIHGIQIIKSHPLLPYYITGNTNGQVGVFEWSIDAAVVKTYSPIQKGKITSLNFDANGNKFGMGDSEGNFSLFHFSYADNSRAQYFQTRCPHKGVLDFCFLNSSSLVATSGGSALHGLPTVNQLHSVGSGNFDTNAVNISMWDVLLPPGRNQVRNLSDPQLAIGVVALCYVSRYELLLAGTRKGEIALIDIRQNKIQNIFQAHESCITAIKLDPLQYYFVSSAADGHIKIWQLYNQELFETFRSEPIKSSVFSKGDLAIKSLDIIGDNKIINCSADGFIKLRHIDLKSLCTNLNNVI